MDSVYRSPVLGKPRTEGTIASRSAHAHCLAIKMGRSRREDRVLLDKTESPLGRQRRTTAAETPMAKHIVGDAGQVYHGQHRLPVHG